MASVVVIICGSDRLILTLLATYSGYSVELLEYRKQFNHDAQSRSTLIRDYLDERVGDLDSLRRFIEDTDTLSRPAFRDFVQPLLDSRGFKHWNGYRSFRMPDATWRNVAPFTTA